MTKRTFLWLFPALLYVLFIGWYTDFGGPLSEAEVDNFVAVLQQRDANPQTVDKLERFLRNDSGRQFLMVNVLDMNENPPDVQGAQPGESADQLMARYMEHMFVELLKRACHPVIMGDAVHTAIDLVGIDQRAMPDAEQWTGGALFRYRSRRSFMQIVQNPAISGKHEFKLAALDKTIAYPVETTLYLGDLRLLLALFLLALTAVMDIIFYGRRASN